MKKFIYTPENRVYVAVKRINSEYDPSFTQAIPSTIDISANVTSSKLGYQIPNTTDGLKPTGPYNSIIKAHIDRIQDRSKYKGDITNIEFKDVKNNYNYRYDGKFLQIIKTPDMANGDDSFSKDSIVLWLAQYKDGENYTWLVMSGSPGGQLREYDDLVYKRRSGSGMSGIYNTLKSLASGAGTINHQALEYDFIKKVGNIFGAGYTLGLFGDNIPSYDSRLSINSAYLIGKGSTIFTCEHHGAIQLVDIEYPIATKEALLNEGESGGIVDKIIYARPYVVQNALESDDKDKNDEESVASEFLERSTKFKVVFFLTLILFSIMSFMLGRLL